jgi:hypothetical protein
MLSQKNNPTLVWKWGFVLVNIGVTIWMLISGESIGDMKGDKVINSSLLIACVLVVLSYLILLGPFFRLLAKQKIKKVYLGMKEEKLNIRMGLFILFLQLSFIAFNLSFGVNIAGAINGKVDSGLSFFWVLVPIDYLFLIYYGNCRESKYFYVNLAVFLVSNVIRGWSGIFLFVLFLEWCQAFRTGKIRKTNIVLGCLLIILVYPFILNMKWLFRAAGGDNFNMAGEISGFFDYFSMGDYFSIFLDSAGHLLARLQITSPVDGVMRLSHSLQSAYDSGVIKPFWLEGLHGIAFDKLFLPGNRPALGNEVVRLGGYGTFDASFNINPGWVGWFFVAPIWIPIFLIYTGVLCCLSIFIARKIGDSLLLRDVVWLIWLVLLIPGWLGQFVAFIYALLVFLVFQIALSKFSVLNIFGRRRNQVKLARPRY